MMPWGDMAAHTVTPGRLISFSSSTRGLSAHQKTQLWRFICPLSLKDASSDHQIRLINVSSAATLSRNSSANCTRLS